MIVSQTKIVESENQNIIALRCIGRVSSFVFGVNEQTISVGDVIAVKVRIDSGQIYDISGGGVLSKTDGQTLIQSPMADGSIQEISDGDTLHVRIFDITTHISIDESYSLDGIEPALREFRKLCS